jgi:methionyl-tRNA formyltransferase
MTDLPEVVFLGAGAFGVPTLEALARAGRVALVVSQPDREAGRGKRPTPTPVSEFALAHGLPLLRTEDCNAPEASARIRGAAADAAARAAASGRPQPGGAMVVIAFGQKLGPALLDGLFAINLHGSLLPRWRGAAPVQRALMEGDPVAGVSVISLAERMDAGVVHAEAPRTIGPRETAGELHDELAALGPDVVSGVLAQWMAGTLAPAVQDESHATRARKLSRADAWVDLSMAASRVRARVNGLNPWPGCGAEVEGRAIVLRRCQEVTGTSGAAKPAGTLESDGTLWCGEGAVRILEVQPPGGRTMDFGAWARGARFAGPGTLRSAPPAAP